MIIYKATNKINGISYIGQTTQSLNKRIGEHIYNTLANRYNSYFHSALKKYGKESFDWDIIDRCDNIDELNRLEIYYIGYYDTYNNGYNLSRGGYGRTGSSKYNISATYIMELYWKRDMPELQISKHLKCDRGIIKRIMDEYNIPRRNMSETLLTRYKNMTKEQINKQTVLANNKCRELVKTGDWVLCGDNRKKVGD